MQMILIIWSAQSEINDRRQTNPHFGGLPRVKNIETREFSLMGAWPSDQIIIRLFFVDGRVDFVAGLGKAELDNQHFDPIS